MEMRMLLALAIAVLLPTSAGTHGLTLASPTYVACFLKPLTAEAPPEFPSSGLIHYWAMEEADITTREDAVGSLDLSDPSDAWSQDTGKHNNCATMDLDVGALSSAVTQLGAAWTIAGWFKATTDGLSIRGLMQQGAVIFIDATDVGPVAAFVETDVVTGSSFNSDVWNHIVVTLAGGEINISVNGDPFATPVPVTWSNPTAVITIWDNSSSQTISVDELGIWNRALSQGEVTTLYNGGAGTFYSP